MPALEPFVRLAATLPAMPEIAQQLIRSFDRDDLSLGELSGLVARDTALAAKVLRTANSARYAPSRSIDTLNDAAASLGLRTMRDLTLSACLCGAFPSAPGFDRLRFWRGTLAVAAYAQTLAAALGLDDDAAYVAGLMLRTGQILMVAADPAAQARIATAAAAGGIDAQFDLEQAAYGCNHADVTAALAGQWQFPESLVAAFRAAGDPMAARPFNRLGAALRLASVVADTREHGLPLEASVREAQGDLAAHVALDFAWLERHLPDHALASSGTESLMH